jgi:MFS family permease
LGATISLFGDQFYLVALPWLVLQLTGSSLALGTILMTAAVPRAVLMLMGGFAGDQWSPRRILIGTASARALLVAAIAALSFIHAIRIWHIYLLAFAFGVADAFSFPALQALIPRIVSANQLPDVYIWSSTGSFTVSPDQRWILYEHKDRLEADITLVENFR